MFTPTLSGLGERATSPSKLVNLSTHIDDVTAVLEFEDLRDVVLVGHSYGGMVVSGVAGSCPERVRELVYLDAFVPSAGEALIDFIGDHADDLRKAAEENDGLIPSFPVQAFGVHEPADVEWVTERLRPQPASTFMQALPPPSGSATAIGRTYIFCLERMGPFDQFADRLKTAAEWRYYELDTGHDAMLTAPRELSELLLNLA